MNLFLNIIRSAALFLAVLIFPLAANAQAWPTKQTIKFIVVYPAGGASDVTARLIATKLSESIGQSVVVENKPGANGLTEIENVVKEPLNGTTC